MKIYNNTISEKKIMCNLACSLFPLQSLKKILVQFQNNSCINFRGVVFSGKGIKKDII